MNLIPQSNGLYKVKNEHKFNGMSKTKYIIFILLGIIILGLLTQQISNFIGNEKIEMNLNYAKVDGKKLEYTSSGKGDYTVVFVGATGTNLYEWDEVAKLIRGKFNIETFMYNRNGYGFSDISKPKTISEQTEELKILLRKAGISGNVILVGEEYGSIIATKFAKDYPDFVKGVVLVDPYDEDELKSADFQNKIKKLSFKANIETYGCYVYLTSVLDKMGKTYKVDGFEESLNQDELNEFNVHKNKKDYRQAIYNEFNNLKDYNENIMEDGMFKDVPLYIVSKTSDSKAQNLGNPSLTSIYTVDEDGLLSVKSSEAVSNGIGNVIKEAKKIAKKEKINK